MSAGSSQTVVAGEAAIAAAAHLLPLWLAGARTPGLPQACRPVDRAQGYAAQAALAQALGQPVVGWKIAATSKAGQEHIGVDGPLAGRLLADRLLPPGSAVSLAGNQMQVAEAEFAFRMAQDLPPRAQPYTQEEVMAAVATLHPTIEIPDSRYEDFVHAGAAQLIADFACARWLVVGPPMPEAWRGIDLASHPVRMWRGDALAGEGKGGNVLGDPRIALTWIANEVARHGPGLRANDLITTGTCVAPVPIAAGDALRADYGVLGSLQARLVPG